MKLILFALALLTCIYSKATIPTISNPYSPEKPWHVKQKEFIEKFGDNNISKTLINFWFANRKVGIGTTAIASPFGTLFGIPFFKSAFKKPVNPNVYAPVLSFSFGVLFSIFLLVSLVGILKIFRFSRKKLYNLLLLYQSSQSLPKRIAEKLERFTSRKH